MNGVRTRHHWAEAILAGVAGLLVLVVFSLRYGHLAPIDYLYRDDGVITMSHARNLVEYGSIGVDPSGSRVEGFSAPVQFWLFAAAYATTRVGFERFADIQTAAATVLLGALLFLLTGLGSGASRVWRLTLTTLCGAVLASLYSFVGWHGSGMENALTHVLFLAAVLGLARVLESGSSGWLLLPVLVLAALTRLEAVWHLAPVLAAFSVAFWLRHRRLDGLRLATCSAVGWGLYQAWRFAYFGSLEPNTAIAQGMEPTARLATLVGAHVAGPLAESNILALQILREHGALLLVVALAATPFIRRDRNLLSLGGMLALLVATGALHPYAFGEARLDPTRTTTHVALAAVAVLAVVAARIDGGALRRGLVGAGLAAMTAGALAISYEPPRFLCCLIGDYGDITEAFASEAERLGVPRPTVSTPDLGKLSWQKRFNIVDLGFLGSPVLATLKDDSPLLADYVLDYSAPDFVESHDSWSCLHNSLLTDPRFLDRYVPLGPLTVEKWTAEHCGENPSALSGRWVRRDLTNRESPESRLIRDLAAGVSIERVRRELERCRLRPGLTSCQYVTRSAYRFLPEFRSAGLASALVEAFKGGCTESYDHAVLTSPGSGSWHRDAVAFLRSHALGGELRADRR